MAHTVTRKPITGHSMQVALIIRKQIGVVAFMEVGARGFMYDENSLYFDAKPKSRIVRVVVTLDPSDTYTVRMVNQKTGDTIWEESDIYNDSLPTVIRTLIRHL